MDGKFQSTRPVRGATGAKIAHIFFLVFQSTRPVRGATRDIRVSATEHQEFQSTRPVRGATSRLFLNSKPFEISIHAPRAGRDPCVGSLEGVLWYFNPRAPCGARHTLTTRQWNESNFNPRAPCGARRTITSRLIACINFNPRAPCGARQSRPAKASSFQDFNPRAPCGARQSRATASIGVSSHFNPRAPCGARPAYTVGVPGRERISIHAPRAGRDFQCFDAAAVSAGFQSTRPVRGATRSIPCRNSSISHFNPRAPCGARRSLSGCLGHALFISIHAPRAGRDSARW